jgi:hypothetical protein
MAPDAAPAPSATFQVLGIFVLSTRALFVVRGQVVSGVPRPGQQVIGISGMDAKVAGVENGLLDVNGGAPQTALTFHYAKLEQLARWRSRVVEGTLLALA